MRMRDEYSYVRGFNIQTEWGATGTDAWLKFDAQRYKTMIHTGKQKFPNINTVRVWLSEDLPPSAFQKICTNSTGFISRTA